MCVRYICVCVVCVCISDIQCLCMCWIYLYPYLLCVSIYVCERARVCVKWLFEVINLMAKRQKRNVTFPLLVGALCFDGCIVGSASDRFAFSSSRPRCFVFNNIWSSVPEFFFLVHTTMCWSRLVCFACACVHVSVSICTRRYSDSCALLENNLISVLEVTINTYVSIYWTS